MPRLLSTSVEQSLRERIASGEWDDDGKLPTERFIAQEYQIARNTARRAISVLVEEGILSRHVGRGTFLMQKEDNEIGRILKSVTEVSPNDLMAVRELLEPHVAAMATNTASKAEIDNIIDAHRVCAAATEQAEFEHLDAMFHQAIFKAARNELLLSLHDMLRMIRNRAPWTEIKRKSFSEERRLEYCKQHELITECIESRDSFGAASAMTDHLEVINANLFRRQL